MLPFSLIYFPTLWYGNKADRCCMLGLGVLSIRFSAAQIAATGVGWDELLLFHQPVYRTEE